jgi:hypothetical protein
MAYGLQTYQDTVRREDLTDVLTDVSPDNNPLMTMLKTTKAAGTYHEWLDDYTSRPTSVSIGIEGAEATFTDLTQPSRRGNFTQIITKNFKVSGTESAVDVAGMGDPYDYQAGKALTDWKSQAEYALVRGAAASGSSGVARQMIGMDSVITSHSTGVLSGCSLSETEFNNIVSDVWSDVGADDVFDMVLVPFGLKQKISSFTAGNTRYLDAEDKKLTRPVMVYESDGGVHRIFAHKDVKSTHGGTASTSSNNGPTLMAIKEDKWRIAYLRPAKRKELPDNGDYKAGQIVGELTLEYLAERTGARRWGYANTG